MFIPSERRLAWLSVEGGLLESCLQQRVPRRLLELDPFQCSVECGGGAAHFYRVANYNTVLGRYESHYRIN